MLITKSGNLAKTKEYIKFKCDVCDCEFIADNTEYEYDFNQHDGESWRIECPCCHERGYMYPKNVICKYDTLPPELQND